MAVTGSVRHYWEIDLGVVGPLSLAEYTQNGFHDLIGVRHAKGWDHQLGDEPGLEAVSEGTRYLETISHHPLCDSGNLFRLFALQTVTRLREVVRQLLRRSVFRYRFE
jgi:hypothetical protein